MWIALRLPDSQHSHVKPGLAYIYRWPVGTLYTAMLVQCRTLASSALVFSPNCIAHDPTGANEPHRRMRRACALSASTSSGQHGVGNQCLGESDCWGDHRYVSFSSPLWIAQTYNPSAGIILGLIVITFAFIIYRRHTRIYGTPQMPSIELRRVSSYVSVFTRRQNTELGANDQGPGYSAPAYSAEPPPYVGPEVELDPKRDARKEYDADLPVKHANASVDVVDAEGMYEYDVPPPPPSPRTISSSSTSLPPPTPPNEAVSPLENF